MLMTGSGRLFVGRESELDWLRRLWQEAAAGERRLGLIGGEPGVGKTRFAAEFARVAHSEGATVLAGRCDEDLGVPYQPFVAALRHFVTHGDDGDLGRRLGRHAGELARLSPRIAFFVGEVVRHLSEIGAIGALNDRPSTDAIEQLGIPEGVREVVRRRLSRLSDLANRALSIAAVVGPEFEFAVLQRATGLDDDDPLIEVLQEAVRARLVVESGGAPSTYRFAHALVRATLYDELPGPRRATLHRAVGEATRPSTTTVSTSGPRRWRTISPRAAKRATAPRRGPTARWPVTGRSCNTPTPRQ